MMKKVLYATDLNRVKGSVVGNDTLPACRIISVSGNPVSYIKHHSYIASSAYLSN